MRSLVWLRVAYSLVLSSQAGQRPRPWCSRPHCGQMESSGTATASGERSSSAVGSKEASSVPTSVRGWAWVPRSPPCPQACRRSAVSHSLDVDLRLGLRPTVGMRGQLLGIVAQLHEHAVESQSGSRFANVAAIEPANQGCHVDERFTCSVQLADRCLISVLLEAELLRRLPSPAGSVCVGDGAPRPCPGPDERRQRQVVEGRSDPRRQGRQGSRDPRHRGTSPSRGRGL
jgi:hypothetical protein